MLTIFSIPKSMIGHIGIIQKNAIMSWQKIHKDIEIILYGDDEGVKELCKELKIKHVENVEKNKFGTPLLDSIFRDVKTNAVHDTLIYSNADIIFFPSLVSVLEIFRNDKKNKYLLGGRRIDLDIDVSIDFSDGWEDYLVSEIKNRGVRHGYSGIDYFIFNKKFDVELKSFAVGRPGWDNWLIHSALSNKIKIFDATSRITALHQNHARSYNGIDNDSIYNISLIGNFSDLATLYNADYIITEVGIKRAPILRRTITKISFTWPFTELLSFKRKLTKKLAHYFI